MRLARNAREAFESLKEDDLRLAIIDQSMVDVDPQHWRDAWAPVRDRVGMVAVATGEAPGEVMRFVRETAAATIAPPYDLRALRAALVRTLGPLA